MSTHVNLLYFNVILECIFMLICTPLSCASEVLARKWLVDCWLLSVKQQIFHAYWRRAQVQQYIWKKWIYHIPGDHNSRSLPTVSSLESVMLGGQYSHVGLIKLAYILDKKTKCRKLGYGIFIFFICIMWTTYSQYLSLINNVSERYEISSTRT
jgi:hypothetical protein